jgi:uncharacterized membrane protein
MLAAMTPAVPNASAVAETVQLAVIVSETLKVVVVVAACDGEYHHRSRIVATKWAADIRQILTKLGLVFVIVRLAQARSREVKPLIKIS